MNSGSVRMLKPKRILVIVMRYLGDVLLATPLLHSLRAAYPEARLDILVYDSTASILAGNPDIDSVITTPLRINRVDYIALVKRLFRQYDWALITQTGDRPFLYGLIAAPFRIAAVPPKGQTGWWKRFFGQHWIEFDNENTHTVLQNLKLLDGLDISKQYTLIPPYADENEVRACFSFLADDYVVLHPFPQWRYKQWTIAGWAAVGRYLGELGFRVVLSGGPLSEERDYVTAIAQQLPEGTVNLVGQTSLAQLAFIIAKSKLFIGPDTGVTHLAAATVIPVIALYGPTNPVKWAPWPIGFCNDSNPFARVGDQSVGNITLLQGDVPCVPCHKEGCEGHRQSHSQCLDQLPVERVKAAINRVMAVKELTVG